MTTTPTNPTTLETVELAPSFRLPLAIALLGVALGLWNLWLGGIIVIFGVFLFIQAATLRLRFTATDLDIYRGNTRIRQFPYRDWQHWEIFWQPVPILFYFREINSIHFVPVLFDSKTLQTCLEQRCSPAS